MRDDAAIADAVEDRFAAIDLDAAQDVRVMADDDVGPCIDRGLGKRSLVGGQSRGRVHDALVERDDDQLRAAARGGNVGTQDLEGLGVHSFQWRVRRHCAAIRRPDAQVIASGALRRGPGCLRPDAVVAEHRDPPTADIDHGGRARLREVGTRAGMRDAELVELVDRVGDTHGAAIGDVISGQRHDTETGARQGIEVFRRRTGRGYVAGHFSAVECVGNFQVADGHVSLPDCGGDSRQPVVGPLHIQHQVARSTRSRPCRKFAVHQQNGR